MRDRTEDHRLVLENALLHLLQHDEIRNEVALAGFSQIWDENPAWYFWLQGIPGAFLLRSIGVEDEGRHSLATYLLHYFPRNSSDSGEQRLLESPSFDRQTTTPVYEHRRKYDDHFIIGEFGVAIGEASQPLLSFCSWKERDSALARQLFELIVTAFAFFYQHAPAELFVKIPEEGIESEFAVYDPPFFHRFLALFGIPHSTQDLTALAVPQFWNTLAQSAATCTAQGLCGCSHH